MHSSYGVQLPMRTQSPLACNLLCSPSTHCRGTSLVPLALHLQSGPVAPDRAHWLALGHSSSTLLWLRVRHVLGGPYRTVPGPYRTVPGRSRCGLLWVIQSELLCGQSGTCAGLLQVALATRPWAQDRVSIGCSGSHSPHFLVGWNETCTDLLHFVPPQCGAGAGCPGLLSLHSPVTWGKVCIGLFQMAQAGLSQGLRWYRHRLLCSGLHGQRSPVAQTGACSVLFQVIPAAGPRLRVDWVPGGSRSG